MGLICTCPVGTALTSVPVSSCPESLGQVQKVIFQRIYSSGSTKNELTAASILLKATWTPLLTANDGTKVVVSPYLNAPTSEAGAAKTYGSGNEVLGGMELIIGREPSSFTASILQSPQSTIKALKDIMCENVGVYLVDENGKIAAIADNITTPTKYYPIPIASFFVGDKMLGGYDAPDSNAISWKFKPNWSDYLKFITPTDFNPLTDL